METNETKLPNYRIYDRTGGGVTQDICAETLDAAIEAGREWIEAGDWNESSEDERYQVGVPLDCCVREIVRVPDLRSITSLPGILDAYSLGNGKVMVECGPESGPSIAMLPGKVVDGSTVDADGYYDVTIAGVSVPTMIDEDATAQGQSYDCSGEYSDAIPDCKMAEHAGENDSTDDAGHVWRSPYSVVGGIKENPGVWIGSGTKTSSHEVCRLCGCHKHSVSAGSQRNPGEPSETITIADRDEASEAWLKRTHSEDDFLPTWLAEMLGCSASLLMTEDEAREWVANHTDEDELDEDELEHAFAATCGRRADDEDRRVGLWSHLNA